MGQYFTLVNYDKRQKVSVGEVGSGFIKMQEFVANDDFGRLLSFIIANGRVDGGAVRSSWAGDEIDLIGDYRGGAPELPKLKHPDPWKTGGGEEKFKNVTRQMIEEFNAYATMYGQPLVRYNPSTSKLVTDPHDKNRFISVPTGIPQPEKGHGYYPIGRAVVTDYGHYIVGRDGKLVVIEYNKLKKGEKIRGHPERTLSLEKDGYFHPKGHEYISGALSAEPGTPLKAIPMPCEENLCPGCKAKQPSFGDGPT